MERIISISFDSDRGVIIDYNNEPENRCFWGGVGVDGFINFTEEQSKEITDLMEKMEDWMKEKEK